MQAVIVLCMMSLVVAIASPAPQGYSNKYDSIDVDALLKNDRVVTQYVKCFLDKGPCTAEGREFRKNIPDALATSCSKCTDAQKNIIRKTSKHIMSKRPADWTAIQNKFDPKGERKEAFGKFLQAA